MSVSSRAGKNEPGTSAGSDNPEANRGMLSRAIGYVGSHPNRAIIIVTIFMIASIGVGTLIATRDLEDRLTRIVFRTNELTTSAEVMHLKDYVESRANGIRSLVDVLAQEKTASEQIADIDDYFKYVRSHQVISILLLSPEGKTIYSSNPDYSGISLSVTKFWNYVIMQAAEAETSGKLFGQNGKLNPIRPFVGSTDTTDLILIGSPVLRQAGKGRSPLVGAVAFLVDQYEVMPSPIVEALGGQDSTLRIAMGFYTRSGFPFIHLWSNIEAWNVRSVSALRKAGRASCTSCHVSGSIETILGGSTSDGTASVTRNAAGSGSKNDEFFWTAARLTSQDVALQDSVWYFVVSADRAPVQASIRSFASGSILLMLITLALLVVILTLSLYAYRHTTLEQQHLEHLRQVAAMREQYETMMEKSNDGIYILFENRFIFANNKFQQMMGYTLEELADVDFMRLVSPESRPLVQKRAELLKRGEKLESQYGFIALSKSGTKIPVEISVSHVPYQGTIRTLGIVRDLSELTAQKQLYENLFNNAPIGLGIYRDFDVIKLNEEASRLLGYAGPDDAIGRNILQLVHPFSTASFMEKARMAVEEHISVPPTEQMFLRKDSTSLSVLVLSQPVVYEGDNAVQFAFVSLEDRKRLEENLEREAEHQEKEKIRLENLLRSLDEGILFQGADGKIEFANAEFCRIFEFDKPESLIGKSSTDLLAHSSLQVRQPQDFVDRIKSEVTNRESVKGDRIEFIDDTIIERSAIPIIGPAGDYIGRIAIFRDITSRERNEETIKRLQRTELLGRLAGGIAHDFNNVLGIIMGSLQMMLRKIGDHEVVKGNAQRALSSAKRGSEVAKRLLQFVRYSPGDFEDFSIKHIIEETVSIINHTFEENFRVRTEYMIEDAVVHGSPGDLQQVILNLARNSNDAMPSGGTFTISLSIPQKEEVQKRLGKTDGRHYIQLMVHDTGEGMEAGRLERIFEPFFTTKEVGKGTGLGLSIVQTIISAHDGFIDVASQPGKGTTFSIYLPMAQSNRSAPGSADHHVQSEEDSVARKSETVLVVEDEPDLREIMWSYLTEKGFNVIAAQDGEEGYETFLNHPEISAVITDLGLPKLPGDELIAKIRANRPDIGCILATGYLNPSAGSLSDANVKLIMKPYSLANVYKVLTEILS